MSLSQYLLEFSICLALFYGLYHFLLRKETFFQLNRWYLLLSPALSMIIPFLDWELSRSSGHTNWDQVLVPIISDLQQQQGFIWENLEKTTTSGQSLTYLDILLLAYLIGVLWLAGRLIYRTWRLMRLIGRGRQEVRPGYTVVRSDERIPAASFLSYVFWQEGPLSADKQHILEHELVHVRQWHSLDVLLMEVWVMLKWFHPFIYWYRNSLRLTHEYIADAYVSTRSGSRLEYARLLTRTPAVTVSHALLHHFNSSIKMRLLMLAKKRSSNWKYLKFLFFFPVTALLLLLFSFDLAEELPEPIVNPLVKMEQNLQDLARQPLMPNKRSQSVPAAAKKYTLKWGDLECGCASEQFPNFYRCENQSLTPRQLRRLIRKAGGFELLMEDQPQAIKELTAVSKYMKDMGGYQGQFDEMDREFNTGSPLWKQAEKGDVFRFTFNTDTGDYFQFELIVDNHKEEFALGTRVEIGKFHFNLSQINSETKLPGVSPNVVSMDVEELKRLVASPLKIRKDNGEYYNFRSALIRNTFALREDHQKRVNSEELDLSRSKPILEAFPADRIFVALTTEDDEELSFEILLRKNSAWDGRKREQIIQWGDLHFDAFQMILLTKSELEALKGEDMYLLTNGGKHLMREATKTESSVLYVNSQPQARTESIRGVKGLIDKISPRMKAGQTLRLGSYKAIDGYLAPPLNVFIDYDWKAVFADRPGAKVTTDNTLVIDNAQPDDLDRLFKLPGFSRYYYKIQVDDRVFESPTRLYEEDRGTDLGQILREQQLPQKKLVVSRSNKVFWR